MATIPFPRQSTINIVASDLSPMTCPVTVRIESFGIQNGQMSINTNAQWTAPGGSQLWVLVPRHNIWYAASVDRLESDHLHGRPKSVGGDPLRLWTDGCPQFEQLCDYTIPTGTPVGVLVSTDTPTRERSDIVFVEWQNTSPMRIIWRGEQLPTGQALETLNKTIESLSVRVEELERQLQALSAAHAHTPVPTRCHFRVFGWTLSGWLD